VHRLIAFALALVAVPAEAQVARTIFDDGADPPNKLFDKVSPTEQTIVVSTSASGARLFLRNETSAGPELLVSDGTASGVTHVTAIPGDAASPFPIGACADFAVVGGADGNAWATDGTDAGSHPIVVGSHPTTNAVCIGQKLIFISQEGQIIATDGTGIGTDIVRDTAGTLQLAGSIAPECGFSNRCEGIAALGNFALFMGQTSSGQFIWRTDGTDAGTFQVSTTISEPNTFVTSPLGDRVFVAALDGGNIDLGVTDGTDAGTQILAPTIEAVSLTAAAGGLLFVSNFSPPQLFFSDGTVNGTQPIANPNVDGKFPEMVALGLDRALLVVGSAQGEVLLTTDGTSAGTSAYQTVNVPAGPPTVVHGGCESAGTIAYCDFGSALVAMDGTVAGTRAVDSFPPFQMLSPVGDNSIAYESDASATSTDDQLRVALGGCGDGVVTFGEQCDSALQKCCSTCSFDPVKTACDTGGPFCDGPGECDGAGNCVATGDPCLETDCNHCDEARKTCFDVVETPCGDPSSSVCDNPDTCDGAGACLANHEPSTTVCRASTDVGCDPAENCDGNGACPPDSFRPEGSFCSDNKACDLSSCVSGRCTPQGQISCDDRNICTTDSCVEPTGCTHVAVVDCCRSDTDCNDHNACTQDQCDFSNNTCKHTPICGGEGEGEGAAGEGEGAAGEGEGEGAAGEGEGAAGEGEGEGAAGEGEGEGEGEGAAGEGEGEGASGPRATPCETDFDCPTNGVVCDTTKHVCVKQAPSGCTCNDARATPTFLALAAGTLALRRRRRPR
jgi:hypothetical protein